MRTFELGRRLGEAKLGMGPVLWNPESIAAYLVERLAPGGMDTAGALFLDERRAVLGHHLFGEEELDSADGASRGILVEALAVGAVQLVPFLYTTGHHLLPEHAVDLYEELYEAGLYFDLEIVDFLYVSATGCFMARSQPGIYQQLKAKKGA